jgi:hypothetical protein
MVSGSPLHIDLVTSSDFTPQPRYLSMYLSMYQSMYLSMYQSMYLCI